eukprot:7312696-Ditylum_brightwellii.AAC.1
MSAKVLIALQEEQLLRIATEAFHGALTQQGQVLTQQRHVTHADMCAVDGKAEPCRDGMEETVAIARHLPH